MKDLEYLKPLVKKNAVVKSGKMKAVTYTRISSSGQSNHSLEVQKETIAEYCDKYDIDVILEFGGKPESAKTDDRKEFNKLFAFIKNAKNTKSPINAIVVSQLDRFSRSDDNIALYNKVLNMGVNIFEANSGQPPLGFQNNLLDKINLLLANEDNQKRRKNCIGGMKKKLEKGERIGHPPMGYNYYGPLVTDRSMYSHDQRIEINEVGKQLKKAWKWKLQGHNNTIIVERLNRLGVKIYKQKLSRIWSNKFYCGVSESVLMEGLIEGNWEGMVTIKEFAKINGLLPCNRDQYESSTKENNRPLQGYIICFECGCKFTGYRSTKTGTHYYKCRKKGCKGGNINAKRTQKSTKDGVHELFIQLLNDYSLNTQIKPIFKELLHRLFKDLDKESAEKKKWFKTQKTILETKINKATDLYIEGKLKDERYEKIISILENDINDIEEKIDNLNIKSSNLLSQVDKCVDITFNLAKIWELSNYEDKQILQKTCFKSHLYYEKEKRLLRISKVNNVLTQIKRIKEIKGVKNKKNTFDKSAEFLLLESSIEISNLIPDYISLVNVFKR